MFIWVENGETPQLAQNGKTISWKTTIILCFSLNQDWSSSSSIVSSTSTSTDQCNCFRILRTLLDPVTTRSGKLACGKPMLTDHDKQATENREPADETNKEDPIKAFLFVYSPSIPLKERSQIRKVLCCFKSGDKKKRKHSVNTHFSKDPNCGIC